MALVACPECGNLVSSFAERCPSCGYPLPPPDDEEDRGSVLLAEYRPSWWAFVWHLVFFWLVVPPIVAWLARRSVVLRVYRGRVAIERGLLTKSYREFQVADIRSIDVDQSLIERIVGVGTITLSTAASVDASERIVGLPHPLAVREQLIAQRR